MERIPCATCERMKWHISGCLYWQECPRVKEWEKKEGVDKP